jgi:hypothetical protein
MLKKGKHIERNPLDQSTILISKKIQLNEMNTEFTFQGKTWLQIRLHAKQDETLN